MSVNINADTTNGLVLTSDTSGELKLQSAGADKVTINSSGNVSLTNDLSVSGNTSVTGNLSVTGNNFPSALPMIAVAASDSFTVNQNVTTKMPFNNVLLDTTNDYDTTNYRWTPSVPGYYQAYVTVHPDVANLVGVFYVRFYKNGGTSDSGIPGGTKIEYTQVGGAGGNNTNVRGMCYMYMNGTTDYMEFWVGHNIGSTRYIYGPTIYTYAQAHLIQKV